MNLDWQGRFDYTEAEVKRLVQKKGGNYMILVKQTDGTYRPVYVGKAENLEERLLQHLADNEPNKCLKEHVQKHILGMCYCYVNSEEDRKNVEYTLYNNYKHECNEKEPEGKKIEITPPF